MDEFHSTETPFNFRHHCWFCGEPGNRQFTFPVSGQYIPKCIHPPLRLPSCKECYLIANKTNCDHIWHVKQSVKKQLIKRYQKHLAIGVNWTKQELADSEFDGGNFEGFKKSAWMMYEIARERVNFNGWPLEVNGVLLDDFSAFYPEIFTFDGVEYPTIEQAITHYATTFQLHKDYFKQVLSIVGVEQFSKAVRFCRLQVGHTPQERAYALHTLD